MFILAKVFSNLTNVVLIIADSRLPDNWVFKNIISTCILGKNETEFTEAMFIKLFLQIPYFQYIFICSSIIIFKQSQDIL